MTTQERSILGAQPFLRGLPPGPLATLAGLCRHVAVPRGQRLFEEGSMASRFWLIDAGQVALDVFVPGQGLVQIERLGRGDVIGLSWMLPPYQWRFGAVATQRMQAFEFDAPAVRTACDADPALGYELSRRFTGIVVHRLQATRLRLLEACSAPADMTS
ncbi:MAG TPA: cyclic nucleotide-binding domain-containing protein [Streptosporangiaceae bacterium]|nr:cyclic nucleotide-binding domain-containing protein [Streptosporangiaceae bacterium]